MADKKKEKLEHIQVKDNGIKLSHKIGDTLGDSKQALQNEIINSFHDAAFTFSLYLFKNIVLYMSP